MSSPSLRLDKLEGHRDFLSRISRRDGAIHLARRAGDSASSEGYVLNFVRALHQPVVSTPVFPPHMLHAISRCFFRDVLDHTVRTRFLPGASDMEGGVVIACNHPSHLDPFVVSLLVRRRIYWMARLEFYRTWWSSALLRMLGAFPINRNGSALGSIKKAISLVRRGRVVGIFPEGEVRRDRFSVLRGGTIKRGVCLIAQRTGCPVVPCVVLGTEALIWFRVYRKSKPCRLWIACGDPIYAPPASSRREGRRIMAEQIEDAMRRLLGELRRDIADSWTRKRCGRVVGNSFDEHDCDRDM